MTTRRAFISGGLSAVCSCCVPYRAFAIAESSSCMSFAGVGNSIDGKAPPFTNISESSGTLLDPMFIKLRGNLNKAFGLSAPLYFFDEATGINAFATQSGAVFFGRRLLEQVNRQSNPGMAIVAVCAHEWGHLVQFGRNLMGKLDYGRSNDRCTELHADFLAGHYIGSLHRVEKKTSAMAALQLMFELGDSWFTDAQHHGTPKERADSLLRGYVSGFRDSETLSSAIQTGMIYVRNL